MAQIITSNSNERVTPMGWIKTTMGQEHANPKAHAPRGLHQVDVELDDNGDLKRVVFAKGLPHKEQARAVNYFVQNASKNNMARRLRKKLEARKAKAQ
jgi:hypothetical protein